MSGYALDPARRAQVIEEVMGFSIDVDLRSFRHGAVLHAAIYPRLPEDLWPFVPLDVPVTIIDEDGDEVEEFRTVPATQIIVDLHGDGALPNLLAVDLPTVPSADLARFAGYCLQFYEYLTALHSQYKKVVDSMTQQHRELVARLPVDAPDRDSSFAASQRAAKADPYVLELERSIVADKQVLATLMRRSKSVKMRIDWCSREQTRRSENTKLWQNTNGQAGDAPVAGAQPRPQSRRPFPRGR